MFLKGNNILTSKTVLYAEYDNINMLTTSSSILINGFEVGKVTNIYLKPEDMKTIVVSMNIDRGVLVPKNAIAEIISTSFVGGKAIDLKFEGVCQGGDCAEDGDYLKGRLQGFLESVVGNPDELDAYVDQVTGGLSTAIDTITATIADPDSKNEIAKSFRDIQTILNNLTATTANLNRFINSSSTQMNDVLQNLNTISQGIASSNNEIKNTLSNFSKFSGDLEKMELAKSVEKVNKTLDGSTATIDQLNNTLKSTDKAVGDLSLMMTKMKNGEGTMGKLISDEELYTNLEKSTKQLELLLQDFRLNPKRYTRILSKKQIQYEKPLVDPSAPTGGN